MGKWEMVRLGDVAVIGAGQGAPQGDKYYSNSGLPFIKAGHLGDLLSKITENEIKRIDDETAKKHKLKICPRDTIIFAKSGMSCLKGYVYKLENDCYVVNHLACVKPINVFPAYLKYYFLFSPPNRFIKDDAYPSISLNDISIISLPFPPLPVQQKIADVLDRACALIEKRKAQIEKLDLLIKSQFIEIFGDPVTNPKDWEVILLGHLAEIVSGVTKGRKLGLDTIETPYLRVANVKAGYLDLSQIKTIPATVNEIEKFNLKINDVLMTEGGDPDKLGRGAIWGEQISPCIHQNHIFRVRLNESVINPLYFTWFLLQPYTKRYFLRSAKQTTGIASINMTQLTQLPVFVPQLSIQNKFANFVQQAETQKTRLQQSLSKLELNYKSLLQKCFQGEIF